MPSAKKKTSKSSSKAAAKKVSPAKPVLVKKDLSYSIFFGSLVLLWAAFCWVTLHFPQYSWQNPFPSAWFAGTASLQMVLLLAALMFLPAWYLRRKESTLADMPVFWSRFFLAGILVSAFFLCFYRKDFPMSNYGEDSSLNMYLPIRMRDLSDYRGAFVLGYGVLPLWSYTALLLYKLAPGIHPLVVQRLTGTLFDLGTLLFLFQIGKELGGRRLALYCAGMGLIGKALLFRVVSGFNYSTAPFAVLCVLWATLRLLRKDVKNPFLAWALLIGVASCSSFPIQPVLIFFIFASLLLVWWQNRSQMKLGDATPWFWISLPFFILYTVFCVGCLPLDTWMQSDVFWANQPSAALGLVILGILVLAAYHYQVIPIKKDNLWSQWIWGAWMAVFFSFPAMTNYNVISRIREHGRSGTGWEIDYLTFSYIEKAFQYLPDTLRALFFGIMEPADTGLSGDPFFGYPETILLVLGMVFCLTRPNTKKIFVLIVALIGLCPPLFAGLPHSGILLCCLAPFWIIAATGLEDLTRLVLEGKKARYLWIPLLLVLLLFAGWSVRGLYSRVYVQWAYRNRDVPVFREAVLRDMKVPGQRVYLSNFLNFWIRSYFNFDGSTYYAWNEVANTIDVGPQETVPNVVVYCEDGGDSLGVRKHLQAAFPQANWQVLASPLGPKGLYAYRCEIPAEMLIRKKSELLSVHPVQGDFWRRTFGGNGLGIDFSCISWQDEVAQPIGSLNVKGAVCNYSNDIAIKFQGTLHMKENGAYLFTFHVGNRAIVTLDHQKILDMHFFKIWDYVQPPRTETRKIDLSPGDHEIEIVTYLQSGIQGTPDIDIKPPGASQALSVWSNYDF